MSSFFDELLVLIRVSSGFSQDDIIRQEAPCPLTFLCELSVNFFVRQASRRSQLQFLRLFLVVDHFCVTKMLLDVLLQELSIFLELHYALQIYLGMSASLSLL